MHLYLTHPQVRIDPTVPVPLWGLSAEGLARTEVLATRPWLRAFGRIVASEEAKARDTAALLGAALDLRVEVRPGRHENDRSATGFLPRAEFEAVVDLFFAHPDMSARLGNRAGRAGARSGRGAGRDRRGAGGADPGRGARRRGDAA
jgi:broad specificity phosphatase PhoE